MQKRDWVDATKGAAIVLVVIGHCWRGIDADGLVPEALFHAVDSRIYAFHMPVFFAVSGLFLAHSLAGATPGAFALGRVRRLIWPMVLWTYLFLAFKYIAGDLANAQVALGDFLIWPIPGYAHLWFLWALFVLHMIAVLISRSRFQERIALPLLAAGAIGLALVPLPTGLERWVGPAFENAPFLMIGVLVGRSWFIERLGSVARTAAAVVFLLVLSAWSALPAHTAVYLIGSSVLTMCWLIVFAGIGERAPIWARGLVTVGSASMGIFLSHTIFTAAMREALLVLNVNDIWLHVLLGTAFGLVGPLILIGIARRTKTHRLLGF
jgi:fucose 4-O-acetylase-like acetyltransferase